MDALDAELRRLRQRVRLDLAAREPSPASETEADLGGVSLVGRLRSAALRLSSAMRLQILRVTSRRTKHWDRKRRRTSNTR